MALNKTHRREIVTEILMSGQADLLLSSVSEPQALSRARLGRVSRPVVG